MNTKLFNIKNLIFSILITGIYSCDGRRDFPDIVETDVILENTEILLIQGETENISPRFIPNVFPTRNYSWEIDDPTIANLVPDENNSVTISAEEVGETLVRIISQDKEAISAEAKLKVIASAPINITAEGNLSVNRENKDGSSGKEGSLKLVDGDIGTKYLGNWETPFYITLEFQEGKVVNFYELTSGNDAPDRDPVDWEMQGSNDGENWEVLDERTDEDFSERYFTKEYYFENDMAYSYYRLNIIKNDGSNRLQLSEWAVYSIVE